MDIYLEGCPTFRLFEPNTNAPKKQPKLRPLPSARCPVETISHTSISLSSFPQQSPSPPLARSTEFSSTYPTWHNEAGCPRQLLPSASGYAVPQAQGLASLRTCIATAHCSPSRR